MITLGRKKETRAKLKWLRGAVHEGLGQIDRGEGLELPPQSIRLRKKILKANQR